MRLAACPAQVAVDYQGAVQIGAGPRQPDADATSHGSATRAAALQVLDTVLRHGAAMRHPDASCAGRRLLLYSPGNPELHAPLGGGAEAWLGFEQVRGAMPVLWACARGACDESGGTGWAGGGGSCSNQVLQCP